MPSIFDYLDYRDYLRDWFAERKSAAPWYSYKLFGDGVGLDQSQVYRILQKQLHVSATARPRFLVYLELTGAAAEYFEVMADMDRSRKESERRRLFAVLQTMRGSQSSTLADSQYGLYEEWYIPVVRALLGILEISDQYDFLARSVNPPIRVEEARHAVEVLRRLRLVSRDRQGIWRLNGKSLSTGSWYDSATVRRYQAQTFRLVEEAVERLPKELRDVNVVNMAVDASAFQDCVAILAEARRQMRDRIERVENPDRIMRLATGFVPVAGPFAAEKK